MVMGEAENYIDFIIQELKPLIDAQYRTLPDPEHTGSAGNSYAGVVAFYMAWDFPEFTKVGSWSGNFHRSANYTEGVMAGPWREIRFYMDSGSTGKGSYVINYDLRDNLLSRSPEHSVVEGDLRHFLAFGQRHNIQEFATRLPNMMTFLYPGTEEPIELLCTADLDCDGNVGIVDFLALLAAWGPNPGHPADFDSDGVVGIVDFLALLANWGPCL